MHATCSKSTWRRRALLAAGLSLLFIPHAALSEDGGKDVDARLRQMEERLGALEDRLRATSDQLVTANEQVAAQQVWLEQAGLDQPREADSALSSFLEMTEFSGWVATSYTFNSSSGSNDGLVGQNVTLPFHPDSNTFQLDQAWFEIDKAVSEESRGGFHVDLLFGKAADLSNGTGLSGNDGVEVFSAYASYLVPTVDLRIDAGELPTLLGAEVVQSPYNFNISRGLVWGLQPVTHTGLLVSRQFGEGNSIAVGVVNDVFSDSNSDTDNMKAVTGQLALTSDTYSSAMSFIYGSNVTPAGDEGDRSGVLDLLLTADPSDNLSLWFNFDWAFRRNIETPPGPNPPDADAYGFALAARLAVTEKFGFAVRGEVVIDDDGLVLGMGRDGTLWAMTATIDYKLTDSLMARLENRFDWAAIDGGPDDFFRTSSGTVSRSNQHVLLAELIYRF